MKHRASKEWLLIEPIVEDMGFELVGVELVGDGGQRVLRVFIDKDGGILIDDCSRVSHEISGILDVEDPIRDSYTLEVSSPGVNRPLFKLDDFERYKGHNAKVRLSVPFEGRRNFSGQLNGIEDDMVLIHVDAEEFLLPIEQIERANIVAEFKKGQKKKF